MEEQLPVLRSQIDYTEQKSFVSTLGVESLE